jgi:flagellar motor switch protein FliG
MNKELIEELDRLNTINLNNLKELSEELINKGLVPAVSQQTVFASINYESEASSFVFSKLSEISDEDVATYIINELTQDEIIYIYNG